MANVVTIDREILERFLAHPSHDVRSFAMSLLITSSSTTKPYSPMAFELLRQHFRPCHADPDAKFRNELLAHSKNMVKRIQGAISVLRKDIARLDIKASRVDAKGTPVNTHISLGAKQIANAGETWLRDSLRAHEEFFAWYLDFLRQELVPTASYQRHITSLKSLVHVLKLGRDGQSPAEQRICQNPQWLRILLDLVMDPFDDVRETAASLLMLFPAEAVRAQVVYGDGQPPTTALNVLSEFCTKAADLASRTSRADHSDGTARSLGLLCAWQGTLDERMSLLSRTLDELEQKIIMAEQDLGSAVMSIPVHGAFAAIRYMWEVLSQDRYTTDELQLLAKPQARMVALCTRIWDAVSYVLCDDSPEGNLPEELEDVEGLDTKGLLSYSFRAIHESSNLLRTVVGNLRLGSGAGCLLPTSDVFTAAGNLAFSQLSTLRHRGAFSSVSLTFTCCCQNAHHPAIASPDGEKTLLEAWYEGTLSCINTQRSTTRRSAGIPSLMTGILASNADRPSFSEVMRTLQEIAATPAHVSETDGSNLPQVHAFNCIKEVFKSSLLSKHAEAYLAGCLQLATGSLKSEVWAIRNCALLLLHALIATLFGTTESKSSMETGWDGKTLRLSYTKYATLPPILLGLLQTGERAMEPSTLAQGSAAESVFPALEIIRRAGPPESHRDELYGYITRYLGSRQWHVREIAARTLCSFLLGGDWLGAVKALLEKSRGSANMMHGTLLTVKFFLERTILELKDEQGLGKSSEDTRVTRNDHWLTGYAENAQLLGQTLQSFENDALICSETAAAYIEVHNLLWDATPSTQSAPAHLRLIQAIKSRKGDTRFTTTALLQNRIGIMTIRRAAASDNLGELKACLFDALDQDTDTACALIEAVPTIWGKNHVSELSSLYLDVCAHTKSPEARAAAITNLAELLDTALTDNSQNKHSGALPDPDALDAFEASLHDTISPALANALLLASGPLMALRALRHNGQMTFFLALEQRLRAWGVALADALHAGQTLDMRLAAARALRSLARAVRDAAGGDAAYLPALLALYNALVDDDEDVREVAAEAAAAIIIVPFGTDGPTTDDGENDNNNNTDNTHPPHHRPRRHLVPADAPDALLAWLAARFGRTHELRAYAASRLAGSALVAVDIGVQDLAPPAWAPPAAQLAAALAVDESLFAVEEQNLFVDEAREAERWAAVLAAACGWDREEVEVEVETGGARVTRSVVFVDGTLASLRAWTEGALGALVALVVRRQQQQQGGGEGGEGEGEVGDDDGPLGWASGADAFALCRRVLVCGRALAGLLGEEDGGREVARMLAQIREAGRAGRLHGLLMSVLEEGEEAVGSRQAA